MAVESINGAEYDPVGEYAHLFSRLTGIVRHEKPNVLAGVTYQGNMVDLAQSVTQGHSGEYERRLVSFLAEKVGLRVFPSDAFMTDASDLSAAVHLNTH